MLLEVWKWNRPHGLQHTLYLRGKKHVPERPFPSLLVCISCFFLLVLLIRKQKKREKVNCREKGVRITKMRTVSKGKGQRKKGKIKER